MILGSRAITRTNRPPTVDTRDALSAGSRRSIVASEAHALKRLALRILQPVERARQPSCPLPGVSL